MSDHSIQTATQVKSTPALTTILEAMRTDNDKLGQLISMLEELQSRLSGNSLDDTKAEGAAPPPAGAMPSMDMELHIQRGLIDRLDAVANRLNNLA